METWSTISGKFAGITTLLFLLIKGLCQNELVPIFSGKENIAPSVMLIAEERTCFQNGLVICLEILFSRDGPSCSNCEGLRDLLLIYY